jgi:hypothetical protein
MVSRQETARPLLTPGEVMQLPATDEIIMIAGLPPIRAKKIRYYEDRAFRDRSQPAPALPTSGVYPDRPGSRPDVDRAPHLRRSCGVPFKVWTSLPMTARGCDENPVQKRRSHPAAGGERSSTSSTMPADEEALKARILAPPAAFTGARSTAETT